MLIFTTRFSKKKAVLIVVALGLAMAALIFLIGRKPAEDPAPPQLVTNEDRVAYLQSLGWEVSPEPVETLQFLLPDHLAEPYLSYNELQNAQGFDLASCCGKQLSRYTYTVNNHPQRTEGVQLNLYICEDQPVAGDVFCAGANGFQNSLVYPENGSSAGM
ncbi:MAG: DUF4830 domain-containing protein [Oscillibacter sp.]|jgi:hypothetical protein|nr:DUF4830 domain-containing protein [Oscillibacter sp.]